MQDPTPLPLLPDPEIAALLSRREGLRILGDVHGEAEAFRATAEEALTAGYALLSLGDLINRGPDSPAVMRLALALADSGAFAFVPGNHEQRLVRHAAGLPLSEKDRDRLRPCLQQLEKACDAAALLRDFVALVRRQRLWLRAGRFAFVHGGLPLRALTDRAPLFSEIARGDPDADLALNGGKAHPDASDIDYLWLDRLPEGLEVVIGHDPIALETPLSRGTGGAFCRHLDGGCGRSPGLAPLFLDLTRQDLIGSDRRSEPAGFSMTSDSAIHG